MTARRVLVGRRAGAEDQIAALLRAAGFEPVPAPLIEVAAPADPAPLREAVSRLVRSGYDWVAFTSVPAVQAVSSVAAELPAAGLPDAGLPDAGSLGGGALAGLGTKVAAVGPGTAAALAAAGVEVALVPAGAGSAKALAQSWPAGTGTVLLPRSDIAPSLLPDALHAKGYDVAAVTAYRTVEVPLAADHVAELAAGGFAAVVLTSGSAARTLARHPVAVSTVVVAIGPSTAAAASAAGLAVAGVAAQPTPAGVVAAVLVALDGPAEPADPAGGPGSGPAGTLYPRSETLPGCSTGRQE